MRRYNDNNICLIKHFLLTLQANKTPFIMKHTTIAIVLICTIFCSCSNSAQSQSRSTVKPGIEVLRDRGFDLLEGKRVGLCTNPTGVDSRLRSTIDILYEAENVNLVALFGPEHGVRGNIHAGDVVQSEVDPKTGITMFSLYGKTRRPTKEMMDLIDVMVYDIQDNGCRSYTYISTMGMLLETCAKYGKQLVVLDRPNPLGGTKIEGNLVEDGYFSFVSQFRIPYLYALTCGELATLLNTPAATVAAITGDTATADTLVTYGGYEHPCQLTVVPMEGWRRDMQWDETGLPWVVASPHVPFGHTAYFYPATGIFGELGYLSIGVGYTMPFELIGATWIDAPALADAMNDINLPGLRFRPIYYKPYYSVGKGEMLQGIQIHITDFDSARLSEVQFLIVQELMRLHPEHDIFANCDQSRFAMFDKVCGTKYIRENFGRQYRWDDVKDYWYKDVETFRELSKHFYLY